MSFSYVRNNYPNGRNTASGGGNGYEGAYQAWHNDCNHNHALKNGGHNEKRSCSLSERAISCSWLAVQHMALARLSVPLICTSIHHGLSEKHADGRLCKRSARFFFLFAPRHSHPAGGEATFTAFLPDLLASVCVALPDPQSVFVSFSALISCTSCTPLDHFPPWLVGVRRFWVTLG